jgi:hypothetical protein
MLRDLGRHYNERRIRHMADLVEPVLAARLPQPGWDGRAVLAEGVATP